MTIAEKIVKSILEYEYDMLDVAELADTHGYNTEDTDGLDRLMHDVEVAHKRALRAAFATFHSEGE